MMLTVNSQELTECVDRTRPTWWRPRGRSNAHMSYGVRCGSTQSAVCWRLRGRGHPEGAWKAWTASLAHHRLPCIHSNWQLYRA